MLHSLKGALAGRRRAILIGIVAAGAAATAAGAAPATLTPWSDHHNDKVVISADSTTTTAELATTTTMHVEPTTVAPTPPTTHAEPSAPPTTPHVEPAPRVEPPLPPTTPAPHAVEPTLPPPHEPPAPATTEVHTPATLDLTCVVAGEHLNRVSCEWSGPIPDGFVRFLLLRGVQSEKGRVPFNSEDPTAHSFLDEVLPPGSYSYVVVIIGPASTSIAHSNLVPITIAPAV